MLGMDCLLTAVIIYLLSDSFGSLIWAYLGLYTDPQMLKLGQRIEVPVGYAHFADPLSPPHSFVERPYNIVQWTDMPRGWALWGLRATAARPRGRPEALAPDPRTLGDDGRA